MFDQVNQELVASNEMTENFPEILVVHEQVIVQDIPEIIVPFPPSQKFPAPVHGQVNQVFVGMRPERLVDAREPQGAGTRAALRSGTSHPWCKSLRRTTTRVPLQEGAPAKEGGGGGQEGRRRQVARYPATAQDAGAAGPAL